MTTLTLAVESPPIRIGDDDSVRIGKTRVILAVFLNAYRDWGWSAEQLAEQFPSVSLAESHIVLANYLTHRAKVAAYLKEWNAEGDDAREKWLASREGQGIQAKIRAASPTRGSES